MIMQQSIAVEVFAITEIWAYELWEIKKGTNFVYRKFSNIRRTKSQNLNASRLIL